MLFNASLKLLLVYISICWAIFESWRGVMGVEIGINWGTVSEQRLPPSIVVKLLQDNKIQRVKLFDADPTVLNALVGSGIQVMVGIPNEMLQSFSSSLASVYSWLRLNVFPFAFKGGVSFRYIAVGNEPFLTSYQGQFNTFLLPAVMNVQQALAKADLADVIKVVVPCNADAYQSNVPSQGVFRPDINQIMVQLVTFLSKNGSPFVVNIYPFLSLFENADFPGDYAFFENSTHPLADGQSTYTNAFDGNFDTLIAALNRIGFGQMPIIIGEIGWPTDGAKEANISNARRFNQGLINHVLSNTGTPLRPGIPPIEVYLFSLFDEDQKSMAPGNFERHWGIFTFDGQSKYHLELGQGAKKGLVNAHNVPYLPARWCVAKSDYYDPSVVTNHFEAACSKADCTTLLYGGLCNSVGDLGNMSYAFNRLYQQQKQAVSTCEFGGLGMITFVDPSIGDCRFLIGIRDSSVVSASSMDLFFRNSLSSTWKVLLLVSLPFLFTSC